MIIGDANGGKNNSPSPDNYDPDRGMKIVKDCSPEWS